MSERTSERSSERTRERTSERTRERTSERTRKITGEQDTKSHQVVDTSRDIQQRGSSIKARTSERAGNNSTKLTADNKTREYIEPHKQQRTPNELQPHARRDDGSENLFTRRKSN